MPGNPPIRRSYEELLRRFEALGADDPEGWARSEAEEGMAQLARFCFLQGIWTAVIDSWTESDDWIQFEIERSAEGTDRPFGDIADTVQRLIDSGIDRTDLQGFARWVAYMATFDVLAHVDGGGVMQLGGDLPGWRLMEVVDDEITDREVGGLHESLLEVDPSGKQGRPRPA